MARILISEPHADVRRLFEHMLARLGHEPVHVRTVDEAIVAAADLLLVETAHPACAELATAARMLRPSLPVVCASIMPPRGEPRIEPDSHLLKPFTLNELRAAVDAALVSRSARGLRAY